MVAQTHDLPLVDPDADRVRRAIQHDLTGFDELVACYQGAIYGLCARLLGNGAEAEEAAQETFLRAYRHLATFDWRGRFKPWLFAIASHYCIDRLRARRLQWTALDDDVPASIDPAPGPEAWAERHELERQIRAVLARLSPADQVVLTLHYWLGFSYREIASTTGTTVSAVKSRLHRAREALRELGLATPSAQAREGTVP
jgi:RNA polymerase sigma-70 factor (ECF subfamily)